MKHVIFSWRAYSVMVGCPSFAVAAATGFSIFVVLREGGLPASATHMAEGDLPFVVLFVLLVLCVSMCWAPPVSLWSALPWVLARFRLGTLARLRVHAL